MKYMNKRAALIFPLIAIFVSGCSNVKYNASFIDDIGQHINEGFAHENEVNISFSESDKPKKIYYVVDNDEKYATAFNNEYKIDVNYEKQFLLVCSFVSIYQRKHNLDMLKITDGVLTIKCGHEKGADGTGYACSPYQRWCAILMDAVEYGAIDFIGE